MAGETEELTVDAKNLTGTLKSTSINTIITLFAAIGVGVLVWQGFVHSQDTRDASAAFVGAIKEQTVAIKEQTSVQREANCLTIFKDPANCQRIK